MNSADSKTAHTPSPWTIRLSRADSTYTHISSESNDSVACTKSEADARLIAAAPDLLAAAEKMVAANFAAEKFEAIRALEAAIAKARGASHATPRSGAAQQ